MSWFSAENTIVIQTFEVKDREGEKVFQFIYLFKTTLHHQLCQKQFFLCYTVCIKIYWTNSQ